MSSFNDFCIIIIPFIFGIKINDAIHVHQHFQPSFFKYDDSASSDTSCFDQIENVGAQLNQTFIKYIDCPIVSRLADHRYCDLRLHSYSKHLNTDAAFIALPQTSRQVLDALRWALEKNLRPTIRSGGHCFANFWSNNTDGLLIDLSAMNSIDYDRPSSSIRVGAGTRISQLQKRLYVDLGGLLAPGPPCLDIGVGGFVAGGGYGYFARKFGLMIDYVDSIELAYVRPDRAPGLITVSDRSKNQVDRDLFWSLRGAGSQNFGVITNVAFKNLPESKDLEVTWCDISIDSISDAFPGGDNSSGFDNSSSSSYTFVNFLNKYVQFFIENSDVESRFCDLFSDLVIKRSGNRSTILLRLITIGNHDNNLKLTDEFLLHLTFERLIKFKEKPVCRRMSAYSFVFNETIMDQPKDGYYAHKSAYMTGALPEDQNRCIRQFLTDDNLAYDRLFVGEIKLRSYGCAVSRYEDTDTAYAHRKALVKVMFGVGGRSMQEFDFGRDWLRKFYHCMYGINGPMADDGDAVMDGCYYNYPDTDLRDRDWPRLYFKDNYERLKKTKKYWDPLNIFNHRQSIEIK